MAILATEKVLTLDYWKRAGDLRVGDIVFDHLGNPTRIKLVQQYRAARCYEVQFNDNLTLAGDEHLAFPVESENYRKQARKYKGTKRFRRKLAPTNIGKLLTLPLTGRENRKEFSVPTTGAIQLAHQDLPVPPFVFGFWFFNRHVDQTMTPPPEFKDFVLDKFKDCGYTPTKKTRFVTTPSVFSHLAPTIPYKIPNNYLLASPEQRQELLSGIMCSKPRKYNKQSGTFRFTSKNKTIAQQVQYLSESLGCKTSVIFDDIKHYYTVFIRTKLLLVPGQTLKTIKVRQMWRLIADIYEITPQACVHIETDGENSTFLAGEGFIACL